MSRWPCTLCGSLDWPNENTSCPLCRTTETETTMDDEKQIQKLEDCLLMCKDTWLRLERVLDDIYDGELSVSDAIEKAQGMTEDIANTLKP